MEKGRGKEREERATDKRKANLGAWTYVSPVKSI
jgi:hypothetical protein